VDASARRPDRAGRQALVRAEKGRAGIEDQLLAGLTPEEKVALRKLLTRALDGLARVPIASPKA